MVPLRPSSTLLVALLLPAVVCCGSDSPEAPAAALDPSRTVVSVSDGEPGVVTEVTVELRDTDGAAYVEPGPVVEMTVAGANGGASTSGSSEGGGLYALRYTPTVPGQDTLTVTLDGDPVPSGPVASRVRIVFRAGEGTPTVDGVLSPGEWDQAPPYEVFAGPLEGSTARFLVDATDLHVALRMPDPDLTGGDGLEVRFDNQVDLIANGDDLIRYSALAGPRDSHLDEGTYVADVEPNVLGAGASAEGWSVVEISHPLDSGDSRDIALSAGASVGVCLRGWSDLTSFAVHVSYPVECIRTALGQSIYAELLLPE